MLEQSRGRQTDIRRKKVDKESGRWRDVGEWKKETEKCIKHHLSDRSLSITVSSSSSLCFSHSSVPFSSLILSLWVSFSRYAFVVESLLSAFRLNTVKLHIASGCLLRWLTFFVLNFLLVSLAFQDDIRSSLRKTLLHDYRAALISALSLSLSLWDLDETTLRHDDDYCFHQIGCQSWNLKPWNAQLILFLIISETFGFHFSLNVSKYDNAERGECLIVF